ncbi:MAG: hypothetical protein ACR2QU_08040, partial [Gammaproteobacteria bacterium]
LNQEAVVEEIPRGREIRVSLLGNAWLECLPLLERGSSRKARKRCPAPVSEDEATEIKELARRVFIATGCRDYARIDIRLSEGEDPPTVIGVSWDGVLAQRGSMAKSAEVAGYSYTDLIVRIVEEAALRYGAESAPEIATSGQELPDSKLPPGTPAAT